MIVIAGREYGRVDDVAKAMGKSKDTIWRWVRDGRFPRGKDTPAGMIWQMERIADFLNKGQPTDKEIRLCSQMNR